VPEKAVLAGTALVALLGLVTILRRLDALPSAVALRVRGVVAEQVHHDAQQQHEAARKQAERLLRGNRDLHESLAADYRAKVEASVKRARAAEGRATEAKALVGDVRVVLASAERLGAELRGLVAEMRSEE
jgi:hypothetical protein